LGEKDDSIVDLILTYFGGGKKLVLFYISGLSGVRVLVHLMPVIFFNGAN